MNVLEVQGLSKHYPIHAGFLRKEVGRVRAADDVNFTIARGETLALVGESGCGKTTVARCILRALKPTAGTIRFSVQDGESIDLAPLTRRALRPLRQHIQLIFQDTLTMPLSKPCKALPIILSSMKENLLSKEILVTKL